MRAASQVGPELVAAGRLDALDMPERPPPLAVVLDALPAASHAGHDPIRRDLLGPGDLVPANPGRVHSPAAVALVDQLAQLLAVQILAGHVAALQQLRQGVLGQRRADHEGLVRGVTAASTTADERSEGDEHQRFEPHRRIVTHDPAAGPPANPRTPQGRRWTTCGALDCCCTRAASACAGT